MRAMKSNSGGWARRKRAQAHRRFAETLVKNNP